jgi:hypothetical protein
MPGNDPLKIQVKKALKQAKDASLVEPGNLDLTKRPRVKNPDGSYSTVFTHTFLLDENNPNGQAINVPGVIKGGARPGLYYKVPDGRAGERPAWDAYQKTKEHLGIYKTLKDAVRAAERLHEDQQNMYGK